MLSPVEMNESAMVTEYRSVIEDAVADQVDEVVEAIGKVAPESSDRLKMAATNALKVSPEAVYAWVDPDRFKHEAETALARPAEKLSGRRNIVIIVPLTLTWLTLALAAIEYVVDITNHPDDIYQPFLALWQNGFPHAGWPITITLADVGFVDFFLLAYILYLTFREQRIQRDAQDEAQLLTKKVDDVTQQLVAISSGKTHRAVVGPDATAQDVANAMQDVIDQAFNRAQQFNDAAEHRLTQIADAAQQSILASQQAVEQLLADRLDPAIRSMSDNIAQLQGQLAASQRGIDQLAAASGQIAAAAGELARNAGAYMAAANEIRGHIQELRNTQGELVDRIDAVGGTLDASARALQQVAGAIGGGKMEELQRKYDEAIGHLRETNRHLNGTTTHMDRAAGALDDAADKLANLDMGSKGTNFWGWLFGRA